MTDTGTWLKTLDGLDVYTEDNEWYWGHQAQGWFHAPGLLTSVPAPPLGTRVADEYERLTTDWPRLRGMFPIRNGVRGSDWVVGMLCRIYLVWYVAWTAMHFTTLCTGWWYFSRSMFHSHQMFMDDRPITDAETSATVLSLLFVTIALACLYLLYMVYVGTVDTHKYALMVGAVVAGSAYYHWRSHQNARHNQIIQAIRDGNRS